MNYQEIQSDLVKKMRGSESQLSLSRKMGFKSNRVNKWETHQRQMKWSDFVYFCQFQKIPIESALRFCLKIMNSDFKYESASDVIQFFFKLYGFENHMTVARRLRIHYSILQRWLSGRVEPDLEAMLSIFDLVNDFVDPFLKRLFERNPGYELDHQEISDPAVKIQLDFVSHHPWALAIISALETKKLSHLSMHSTQSLADFLEMDPVLIDRTLQMMVKVGILKLTQHQTYELERAKFNLSNLPIADILRPAHFWNDRIQTRIGSRLQGRLQPTQGYCYFSDFRVMAVSEEEIKKLNAIIAEYVGKISSAVKREVSDKEKVSILVLHHFDAATLPATSEQLSRWVRTYESEECKIE